MIIEANLIRLIYLPHGRCFSSIHTNSNMPSTTPVILILGSGPNIGQHVAQAFIAKGYKVALASRSLKEEARNADQVHISADLSDPHSMKGIFSKVKASLGLPSVVVYNGQHVPYGSPFTENPLIPLKHLPALRTIQRTPCLFPWMTLVETCTLTRLVRFSLHNRRL